MTASYTPVSASAIPGIFACSASSLMRFDFLAWGSWDELLKYSCFLADGPR
jgi:hypothetical protein